MGAARSTHGRRATGSRGSDGRGRGSVAHQEQPGLPGHRDAILLHLHAAAGLAQVLYAITEPVLRPIRNMLPNLGGIDISPVIVILIIVFIQSVILPNLARLFY